MQPAAWERHVTKNEQHLSLVYEPALWYSIFIQAEWSAESLHTPEWILSLYRPMKDKEWSNYPLPWSLTRGLEYLWLSPPLCKPLFPPSLLCSLELLTHVLWLLQIPYISYKIILYVKLPNFKILTGFKFRFHGIKVQITPVQLHNFMK